MTQDTDELSWKDHYKEIYEKETAKKNEEERLKRQVVLDKFSQILTGIVGHEVITTSEIHEMDGVKFKLDTEDPENLRILVGRQCRSCFDQTDLPVSTPDEIAFAIFAPDSAVCHCTGSKFQHPDGAPAVIARKGGH